MKSIICAVAFAATLATQATADVEADLDYLISQQVNRTMFEGALIAQRPLLVGAIENELRKRGMSVSDIERFLDIFMEEFIEEFTETMQDEARSMYKETFSEQEITDIAAFLRTPSGQAMVAATPSLMADGARRGQIAGVEAGNNAAPRVLRRIREEGITFDNPALIDQMIDEFDI